MVRKHKTIAMGLALSLLTSLAPLSGFAQEEAQTVNLALGKSYTLTTPYQPDRMFGNLENSHPDDTGNQLTDGVYGGTAFSNKAFIGRIWQGSRNVVLDLGDSATIQEISLNVLQDIPVGIFFPEKISYSISQNGVAWEDAGTVTSSYPSTAPGQITQKYTLSGINKVARYVQLNIDVETWLFMDELEVLGTWDRSGDRLIPSANGPKQVKGYPTPGSEQTGGIHNQVLIYTGEWQYQPSDWISFKKEDYLPYVSYVDENQERKDFMFDGFLFLPYGPLMDGANYGSTAKPTNKGHFEKFLDRLFRDNYELGALNEAVKEAKAELPDKNYEAKVVIAIPLPRVEQSDFGDVDGDGISENLNVKEIGEEASLVNRKKVVEWYVDEVYRRWEEAGYSDLKLVSFYWYNEYVGEQHSETEDELIQFTGDYVRSKGAKLQWIPYYFARGWNDWKKNGFDSALIQPNYFFHNTGEDRLDTILQAAYDHGLGIEIELSDAVLTNPASREKYYSYLNKGREYHAMVQSYSGFYQQVKTLLRASQSADPAAREVYDRTYEYLKGTYQPQGH